MTTFQEWLASQNKVTFLTPNAMAEAAWNAALTAERQRVAALEKSQAQQSRRRAQATIAVLKGEGLPLDEVGS